MQYENPRTADRDWNNGSTTMTYLRGSMMTILLASSLAIGQTATGETTKLPVAPSSLQVPEGNTLYLVGHATGTQNYICLPSASGLSWTFFAPQATLFQNAQQVDGDTRRQMATHFLSPNPFESGKPRATWQSSFDTSAVWGKAMASSSDSHFVAASAIPWLLLQVVGAQQGPAGGAILKRTTFIQRLNTSGGVAPTTGCSESANIGSTALVPYTADYFFYQSSRKD